MPTNLEVISVAVKKGHHVGIDCRDFDAEKMQQLFQIMKNSSLNQLSISFVESEAIWDRVVKFLIDLFDHNPNITNQVCFSYNTTIVLDFSKLLVNTKIFRTLSYLAFYSTNIFVEDLTLLIARCNELKSLTFFDVCYFDRSILAFNTNNVTNYHKEQLVKWQNTAYSQIGKIIKIPPLNRLFIHGDITEYAVKSLAEGLQYSSVSYLMLDYISLNNEGLRNLVESIKNSNSLIDLTIRTNKLTDESINLLLDLAHATTLRSLNICQNQISSAALVQLVSGLKNSKLQKLYLPSGNAITYEQAFESLETNFTLSELHFDNQYIVSSKYIERNRLLQENLHASIRSGKLDAIKNIINNSSIDILLSYDFWSNLGYYNSPLHIAVRYKSYEIIRFLIQTMRQHGLPLTLRNTDGFTPQQLTQDPKLFALFNENENDANNNHYNVPVIPLDESSGDQRASLQVQSILSELEIHPKEINQAVMTSQDTHKFDDQVIELLIPKIVDNKEIELIDFSGHLISDAGAKDISHLLATDMPLTHLILRGNRISAIGAKSLAEGLKNNKTLRSLSLWDNQIGNEGVAYIAGSIVHHPALRKISMGKNSITDDGIEVLAKKLENNKSIRAINLAGNLIGEEGKRALRNLLSNNYIITTVDLDQDDPEVEGFVQRNKLHKYVKNIKSESRISNLIESGVNLLATSEDENTALHVAVMSGHVRIVKLLIEKMMKNGISLQTINKQGKTAEELADGNIELQKLFPIIDKPLIAATDTVMTTANDPVAERGINQEIEVLKELTKKIENEENRLKAKIELLENTQNTINNATEHNLGLIVDTVDRTRMDVECIKMELKELYSEYNVKKKSIRYMQGLIQYPNRFLFYRKLQSEIQNLNLKRATGTDQSNSGIEKCITSVDKLNDAINLLIPNVPVLLTTMTKYAISKPLEKLNEIRRENYDSLTLTEMERISIDVAQRLTEWYTPVIDKLATKEQEKIFRKKRNIIVKLKNAAVEKAANKRGYSAVKLAKYIAMRGLEIFAQLDLVNSVLPKIDPNDLDNLSIEMIIANEFVDAVTQTQFTASPKTSFFEKVAKKLQLDKDSQYKLFKFVTNGHIYMNDGSRYAIHQVLSQCGIKVQTDDMIESYIVPGAENMAIIFGLCQGTKSAAEARNMIQQAPQKVKKEDRRVENENINTTPTRSHNKQLQIITDETKELKTNINQMTVHHHLTYEMLNKKNQNLELEVVKLKEQAQEMQNKFLEMEQRMNRFLSGAINLPNSNSDQPAKNGNNLTLFHKK